MFSISLLLPLYQICFFNNFVYDPERPSEQETRASPQSAPGGQPFPGGVTHPVGMSGGMGWGRGGGGMMQPGKCVHELNS